MHPLVVHAADTRKFRPGHPPSPAPRGILRAPVWQCVGRCYTAWNSSLQSVGGFHGRLRTAISLDDLGLEVGTPGIKSVGPLAFGPEGILFIGDNVGAAIFAVDVGDSGGGSPPEAVSLDNFDTSLASYLGCSRDDVAILDMAVHPTSGNLYFSVMRAAGTPAVPVIIKVSEGGAISDVSLENVAFAQTVIEDAADEDDPRLVTRVKLRTVTVTDMSYVDGLLLVAGTSNEEFSSTLGVFPSRSTATSSPTRWKYSTCPTASTRRRPPSRLRALPREHQHPRQLHLHSGGAILLG